MSDATQAPLLGFQYLNPPFCIHRGGPDLARLPSGESSDLVLSLRNVRAVVINPDAMDRLMCARSFDLHEPAQAPSVRQRGRHAGQDRQRHRRRGRVRFVMIEKSFFFSEAMEPTTG